MPDGTRANVAGIVNSYLSVSQFTIEGTQVDASNANITPASRANFGIGYVVEVDGTYQGGVLRASRVKIKQSSATANPGLGTDAASARVLSAQDATPIELYGTIDDFVSLSNFTLRNQKVDASTATLSGRQHNAPAKGRQVSVRGMVRGATVVASSVHFDD